MVASGYTAAFMRASNIIFGTSECGDSAGAFRVAAEPEIRPEDLNPPEDLARPFRIRELALPASLLRVAAALTWRLGLQPADPGWIDLGLGVPTMDTARAPAELG